MSVSATADVLVIDNYDSFTYNLVQYLEELGAGTMVVRNDQVTVHEVAADPPRALVISPGPGTPSEAGICLEIVTRLGERLPMLGVCLGHQVIGQAYGGRVVRAPVVMHGKVSAIHHLGHGALRGLNDPFEATRYHSLIVERDTIPDCLEVTAWTVDGLVMALRHRRFPVEGVQFHPESIRTGMGRTLLANFLESAGIAVSRPVMA
ncbi:MAG: aminodeoxychorismate/anthranilate synthase component II [Candidatus Dormibacteria bacterium]